MLMPAWELLPAWGSSASSLGVSADCLGIIISGVRTTYNLTVCLGRTNKIIGISCLGGKAGSLGRSAACLGGTGTNCQGCTVNWGPLWEVTKLYFLPFL